MFGDDFKKSLEPIQTSDELLERTRKAIEASRYEQAKASSESSNAVVRTSRFPLYMKAIIPVACVALLLGGSIFVISRLNSGKASDSAKNAAGNQMKADSYEEISVDYNAVAEVIDGNGNYQSKSFGENSEANDDMSFEMMDGPIFLNSQTIDGKTLSIDLDGTKLVWGNPDPETDGSSFDVCQLPNFPKLGTNDKIVGLNFSQNNQVLQVMLSIDGKTEIYMYRYNDGNWALEEGV